MRITEGQLRRIIRQELNEMKGATFHRDLETGEWKSGKEDFPGAGAEAARQVRARDLFRRSSGGDPDFGKKLGRRYEKMMASLDLDEPGEYLPSMFTGTEADNVARFNDEISSKLPMKGSMFKPASGPVKTEDFFGTYEIKRVPGEPELFEASVMRGEDPDTEAGVASADTPYEAVMNAVENASYSRRSPAYGRF